MKLYGKHISQYVEEPSLLLLDRASSHTSHEVKEYLEAFLTKDGEQLLTVLYLPPKTAFVLSPLDNGAISAFKQHFYTLDRSTFTLKKSAVKLAWDSVSNESLLNICINCGLSGDESLTAIRQRFEANVHGVIPEKFADCVELFDRWSAGVVLVAGADRHRSVELNPPQQLEDGTMDGGKWIEWGSQ